MLTFIWAIPIGLHMAVFGAPPALAQTTPAPPAAVLCGRIIAPRGVDAAGVRVAVLATGPRDITRDITLGTPSIDADGALSAAYTEAEPGMSILLRFTYPSEPGAPTRVWVTAPEPGRSEFVLPGAAKPTDAGAASLDFRAPEHGFHFVNHFEGSPLPAPLEKALGIKLDSFGLCGGMSFAAADMFLARRAPPDDVVPPPAGSALYRYIYQRQTESLGGLYIEGLRFARWMGLPVGTIAGAAKRTYDESRSARLLLDAGRPAVLGLNYVGNEDGEVWENHQVLAIGYEAAGDGTIVLHIYDPNFPGRDDVTIRGKAVVVGAIDDPGAPGARADILGLECRQFVGRRDLRPVRGFFVMPYSPAVPPENLSVTVGAPR